MTNDKLKATE
jgi:hypothetical protein